MLEVMVETCMYFGILYGGYRYGVGCGAVVGGALGIIETIRLKNLGALGIMSIMGVLTGIFGPLGKFASVAGCLAGAAGVGTLYAPALLAKMIPSLLMAAVSFFCLPRKLCAPVRVLPYRHKKYVEDGSLSVKRLKEMACSLEQLSKSFKECREEDEKIPAEEGIAAFQTAAAVVCRDCRNCHLCRTTSKGENYYVYYLLETFENNGHLVAEDMPRLFVQACEKQDIYMDQINYSLGKVKNNLTWKNRFIESREMFASQFLELSNIVGDFSERIGAVTDITEDTQRIVRKALKGKNIHLDRLLVLEQENKRKEVYLLADSGFGGCVTAKELAEALSEALNCRLKPARDSKNVVHKEAGMIHLVEDTNFMILHGVAKAVKDHNPVSGDNFSYFHLPEGRILLGLSDGMGSGEAACKESEKVIELVEQLMDSGFSMEAAARMVHSVLLLEEGEQQPTTLDMACIDLYTGIMEGMKFGAANSFVIHKGTKKHIEVLASENLPMGMLKELEPQRMVRPMKDGDMLIMMTDGVAEAFSGIDKEQAVSDFLQTLNTDNPGDVADAVLEYACAQDGEPKDDMLIMTAGIWKKQ